MLYPTTTTFLTTLLLACTAAASPLPAVEVEASALSARQVAKAPFFILVGDSTTAPIQPWKGNSPPGGGGWGDGFLATMNDPRLGVNLGHNGQTTVSYRENGWWKEVVGVIAGKVPTNEVS